MKESSTYQYILEEGRTEEARKILLRHGTRRFGIPDAPAQQAIENITSVEILETLIDRAADVESWSELPAAGHTP